MTQNLLFLELNEVNFDHVQFYCQRGALPHFDSLIRRNGIARTISEKKYEELEPWIQWVTAHTGLSFAEHKIFRLGDIVNAELPQIWEALERRGLTVGAISPMNAKHRLEKPAFFVPDPWTPTKVTAGPVLTRLYRAISQAVNDNAQSRITASTLLSLLVGLAGYARPSNYARYLRLIAGSRTGPWRRAMVLDLLLADVFMTEVRRSRPNFATLFLNAAAHIQHHYMFCAAPYSGPHRNPAWYVRSGLDPVLEIYSLYDHILGQMQSAFPEARLMVATGLHQVPHEELTFYWRLRDHASFLKKIGVPFLGVEPLMSRDFVLTCASSDEARAATERLSRATAADGAPLFEIDNRGQSLFVMLSYARDIPDNFSFSVAGDMYADLKKDVAFVALKNGEHDGMGYFIDTGLNGPASSEFPLKELPQRIMGALGLGVSPAGL